MNEPVVDNQSIPEINIDSQPVSAKKKQKAPKTAWKPGQSGNPNGRPKKEQTMTEILRLAGEVEIEVIDATTGVKRIITRKERLAEIVWEQSMVARDKAFVKLAYERIDGLPIATDPNASKGNEHDVEFSRYKVRQKLFDEQLQLLFTKKRRVDMLCGRRSGKTVSIAAKMVDMALSHSAGTLLYVSKTFGQAYKNIWRYLIEFLDAAGLNYKASSATGEIDTASGCRLLIAGSDTIDAVEKMRGDKYLGVFIDEVQSLKYAKYMVNDVLKPAMKDYIDSLLVLSGTPSRTAKTAWEQWWTDRNPDILKSHWTMEQNIHIPESERDFEKIKRDEGWTDDTPRFQREYQGLFIYDKEAQVYMPTSANYFIEEDFKKWVELHRAPTHIDDKFLEIHDKHQLTDIEFSAGLDYGFSDSDGYCVIAYSNSMRERWVLYEYKQNHTGVEELATIIRRSIEELCQKYPRFKAFADEGLFQIYADYGGAGAKISYDLRNTYHLPVVNAYKQNKDLAIDMLQDEIRKRQLKLPAKGLFDQECESIVWQRDEDENIIRTIDDDVFHPDLADAVLYAMRPIWKYQHVEEEK